VFWAISIERIYSYKRNLLVWLLPLSRFETKEHFDYSFPYFPNLASFFVVNVSYRPYQIGSFPAKILSFPLSLLSHFRIFQQCQQELATRTTTLNHHLTMLMAMTLCMMTRARKKQICFRNASLRQVGVSNRRSRSLVHDFPQPLCLQLLLLKEVQSEHHLMMMMMMVQLNRGAAPKGFENKPKPRQALARQRKALPP
jgi:hypothetical protein